MSTGIEAAIENLRQAAIDAEGAQSRLLADINHAFAAVFEASKRHGTPTEIMSYAELEFRRRRLEEPEGA